MVTRTSPVLFKCEVRAETAREAIRKARAVFAADAERATCKAERRGGDVRL